ALCSWAIRSPKRAVIATAGGDVMDAKTGWEWFKAASGNVAEKVRQVVHEGNVRRVVVKHEGRTVAEFPLTAGVVGAVLAPVLAAMGALVALLKDCWIEVERTKTDLVDPSEPRSAASA